MAERQKAFLKNFYRKDINKRVLIHLLKEDYSFDDQKKIIKKIPKIFESLIFGKPLIRSFEDFGSKRLSYKTSTEYELNWLVHLFEKFAGQINNFLEYKIQFENNFLRGDYNIAAKSLNNITKISKSYWGLENNFLQTQYQNGLEYNFKLLNSFKELKVQDAKFYYLVPFFSNKVEEDISYFSYLNSIEHILNWGIDEDYKSYFSYRLNPIGHTYGNLSGLLWAANNHSLIDKYLLYKSVVSNILVSTESKGDYEYLKEHFNYLSSCIHDPFFKNALFVGFNEVSVLETNEIELSIYDHFTKGEYDSAISLSKSYLEKDINFRVMEVFVKSHLHLTKKLVKISNENSLLNTILGLIYTVLSRNEKSNEAVIDLLTIANAISSFDIANALVLFLSQHINKKQSLEQNIVAYLFSKTPNPLFFDIFETLETKKLYLENYIPQNSLTGSFFKKLIEKHPTINELNIPNYRSSFYKAKIYFSYGEFKLCISQTEEIIERLSGINYLYEQCLKLRFDSFLELSQFDNALNLYVDNYIVNPSIVSKIESEKLSQKILDKRWKGISLNNINFPIFMYLSPSETHSKYIAYDLYMRTQNTLRPSKLAKIEDIIFEHKLFFLKNVANQKIISRKAIVFKNSTEVLKERIAICQILAKIDEKNSEEYNLEISDITQRLTVQQRIKEIDESKIYIDELGIFEKELGDVQKGFNRFKNISQLLKESNIDATGIGYDALYDLLKGNIDTETYKKSLRKTDIHFELFTQLFLEIRDKFLFSNQYGLDYYLSQRIRHGTIINQLRKSFKTHNLITTKSSKSDSYLPNSYWINKLEIQNHTEFEERLKIFSNRIDTVISDLKNKFIQIKTEDPKTIQAGWFDYTYIPIWNSTWLYSQFIKEIQFFTDFEEFVNSIFEILWQITDRNLAVIREKLKQELKTQLISELDNLEVDLKKLLPNKEGTSLFRSIAECRTNIQADVDYVITWFNKSKNKEIDFTFEDALNTSLQIVNNIISPNILEITVKNETCKDLLKGKYFTHFVDLFKIFLTNIYDYYLKSDIEKKGTKFEAFQQNDRLTITFSNSLKEGEDIEALKNVIESKQLESNKQIKGIRGEGSTGFPKANNILKNVFRNNNSLNFEITEEKFVVKCEILLNNLKV
uniref:hypothetical protein n=1 Tax=uncultured Christiangramia sp. TaxID=503836 RepID=UPI0026176AAB|nr:hypothetical protein [uncultured Christiangramia sp.]